MSSILKNRAILCWGGIEQLKTYLVFASTIKPELLS